ncbi:hypothetical protein SBD_0145 [Streptomyces bottropensis ATCC 25435]|uniref:Uncharacterized protein n=1 Tax=Streptomyces bottropensis ATCC 25435 TaxID=1054862 RepID=M3F766_9ACTN|nr:hypothetical protein SBD_0145 [Streptomyces bottropensis ATCC 25435]
MHCLRTALPGENRALCDAEHRPGRSAPAAQEERTSVRRSRMLVDRE